jgi:hypothetical protein
MMEKRLAAVDEKRRAVGVGQFGHWNVFTMQNSVAVMKMVHSRKRDTGAPIRDA